MMDTHIETRLSSDRMGTDLARMTALAGMGSQGGPVKASALKQVSEEFEAVFVRQLLEIMRQTVPKSDFLQRGLADDIYTGMMDSELASSAAHGGGLGLAPLVFESLAQGVRNQGGEIVNDVMPNQRPAAIGYMQQSELSAGSVDQRG